MSQAQTTAEEFDRVHHEVLSFVDGCSDADWRATTPEEGWPVGALVIHIADGYTTAVGWAQDYLAGRPVTITGEEMDRRNALRLEPASRVGQDEARELLRTRAGLVSEVFSRLSDEELGIAMPFSLAGGRVLTLGQLTAILARHTGRHLTSARAAVS